MGWDLVALGEQSATQGPSTVPGSGPIRARETTPRRHLRILWHHRRRGANRGASYPSTERPGDL
jgi:hypothetical protein